MVAVVALLVTASGIGNDFAFDDVEVIAEDAALHSLTTAPHRAFAPYLGGQMLRPVPLMGFAIQWAVGDGSPLVFRVVSLALYAMVSALVFVLCRRAGASPRAALAGGLLFAVHPVHSEVTANGVGQLELLTAATVLGAALWYLRARATPDWRRHDTLMIALLFLVATHTKESGYVLPGLLVSAELLVVVDPRPWRDRLASLREPALVLLAVLLGSLAVRSHVLGEIGGGLAHASLAGLGLGERAVVFLGLAPEWFRLLAWPAGLQAEYGPPALDPGGPLGAIHAVGMALILSLVVCVILTWRRAPLIALGTAWIGIAMAPVANLLFPTGILLAERTLFLPSVGLALAVAGLAKAVQPKLADRPAIRAIAMGTAILVLLAAGWRTAIRQPEWRDSYTVLEETVRVSPETYRAHLLLGREQRRRGELPDAEASFFRAGSLWFRDSRPFEELGQMLRARGECAAAIDVLVRGVAADSSSDVPRSRLVECLIVERRWDEAEREIERGLAQGVSAYRHALARVQAGRQADRPD